MCVCACVKEHIFWRYYLISHMTRTICHNLVVFRKTKRKETIFIANGVGRMKHKIITNGHYALVRHGLFELMTCEYSASSVDMPKKISINAKCTTTVSKQHALHIWRWWWFLLFVLENWTEWAHNEFEFGIWRFFDDVIFFFTYSKIRNTKKQTTRRQ